MCGDKVIVIEEDNKLSTGERQRAVAAFRDVPILWTKYILNPWIAPRGLKYDRANLGIGRSIVRDTDFEIWIGLGENRFIACFNKPILVLYAGISTENNGFILNVDSNSLISLLSF